MFGGFNKGINNAIKRVNCIIKEEELTSIPMFKYYNKNGEQINHFNPEIQKIYEEVIELINKVIGKLSSLVTPAAPRTHQKKREYKEKICELEELKNNLQQNRKYY